jgi:hypothetical protein
MKRGFSIRSLFFLCFLLLPAGLSHAVLPPGAFTEKGDDQVQIRVWDVQVDEDSRATVRAEVLEVRRTRSDLKAGDVITIRYVPRKTIQVPKDVILKRPGRGILTNPDILTLGDVCDAYLGRVERDKTYVPVAYQYSFSCKPENETVP